MKKIFNFIALVVCFSILLTSFVGCSGNGGGDEKVSNELEIVYWNSGLGDTFIKNIVDEFKKDYPDYNVKFNPNATTSTIEDTLDKGAKYNTIDLYITVKPRAVDHKYIEPLNTVLNSTAPGDVKTIKEKYNKDILNDIKDKDGNYYQLTYYAGVQGLVYNAEIIDGVKYKVPKTTDELLDLVSALKADDACPVPFIHYKGEEGGNWAQVYEAWRAQYVGLDSFYDFFDAKELDQCTSEAQAKNKLIEIMSNEEDGRLYVLNLLNELVNFETCYNGSNSLESFAAQSRFLDGEACMNVNGAWLEKEMKKENKTVGNFKLMKTPVFSKVVEKFEGADKEMSDEKLSEIIDLIDAETPYSEGVYGCMNSTYEKVKEARCLMAGNTTGHAFTIPNYATGKEAAKEFIKFYFSDKATRIFVNEEHLMPVVNYSNGDEIDISTWSQWAKDCFNIQKNCRLFSIDGRNSKHEVFSIAGAGAYARLGVVSTLSTNPLSQSYQSASALWKTLKNETARNAETYIVDSGIIF